MKVSEGDARGSGPFSPSDRLDINTLFDEVYPSLHRYCYRLTADPDLADDVAQEAFTVLLEKKPRGPESRLRAWLFRVATNLIRDEFRQNTNRRRILAGIPPRDPIPSPGTMAEQTEKIRAVRAALEQVSLRDRKIILLRNEGLSYRELAEALEVAPNSVGTLLARAIRRFAVEFEKENRTNTTSDGGGDQCLKRRGRNE